MDIDMKQTHRGPSHQMSIMNKRLEFAYLVFECLIENRRHLNIFPRGHLFEVWGRVNFGITVGSSNKMARDETKMTAFESRLTTRRNAFGFAPKFVDSWGPFSSSIVFLKMNYGLPPSLESSLDVFLYELFDERNKLGH